MTHHATEIMEMWQEGKWESLPESLKDKRLLFLVARHERNERLIRHICIKTLNEQNCSLLLIQGTTQSTLFAARRASMDAQALVVWESVTDEHRIVGKTYLTRELAGLALPRNAMND